MLNICIVAGARPNFMKVAPLIWAINKFRGEGNLIAYKLIYTGSHDDKTLETSLFADLQIPEPDVYLGVECSSLNELTGRVMFEFEQYLLANKTDIVIVVDDLASTMAVAIVTKKKGIRLAHILAGTRSFDISMPKEINKLVIDGLSDYLFTAGIRSNSIVTREGASLSHIYMVGNILMDTLRYCHPRFYKPKIIEKLEDKNYILLTINRKALLSDKDNLSLVLSAMVNAVKDKPIIAPLHKQVADVILSLGFERNINIIPPMSYLEFGYLLEHALGIVTDSGNVAEEATFNNVPCVTLNNYTEHIETVTYGTNVLVGENAEKLVPMIEDMLEGKWKKSSLPERWDGRTADRIIRILSEEK